MKNEKVNLIECINTFQGEGPDVGKRMLLIRYKKCNYVDEKRPCPWCDTLIKMRVQEEFEFSFDKIQNIINDNNCGLMITGGEPGYTPNLKSTISMLNELDYPYANVETNGCNLNEMLNLVNGFKPVKFIYSPKIFNSDDFSEFKNICNNHNNDQRLFFKIVVPSDSSFVPDNHVLNLFKNYYQCNDKVYLMPQGKNNEDLIKSSSMVFDLAEKYFCNVTTRMHIIYKFV